MRASTVASKNQINRRAVLRSGLAVAALGAVSGASGCTARPAAPPAVHGLIRPDGPQVAAAEAARHVTGGQVIRALVANQLPVPTTVHWHGVAIRNNMDGVPDMTQRPIPAGREFTYQFAVTEPGTY